MATVKNYGLGGVSGDVQFGKSGGRFLNDGTDFTATLPDGSTLTNVIIADPTDDTHAATQAYVNTQVEAFVPASIEDATDAGTKVLAQDAAIQFDVDASTSVMVLSTSALDLTVPVQGSDGTAAAPAFTFETTADAGLSFIQEDYTDYEPSETTHTAHDHVVMSAEGLAVQKWRVSGHDVGGVNNWLAMESTDTTPEGTTSNEMRLIAENDAGVSNVDIRLVPKGTGQVFLGDAGTAASISSSDAETGSGLDGEDLGLFAGDGDGVGDGGNILISAGKDGGTDPTGTIQLTDGTDNMIMELAGVENAVNYFTATNAITATGVTLAAAGTDTDIDINLSTKGAGEVIVPGTYVAVDNFALITKGEVDSLLSGGANRIENDATTTFFDTELVADTASITSVADIDMNSGANITMDGVILDATMTGAIQLDGVGASNLTADTGTLTLSTTTSGNVALDSVANITLAGVILDANMTGAVQIDGVGASNLTATSGNLTVSTTTSGNVALSAADDLTMAGTNLDANMTGAITLDGVGASNLTTASGGMTLESTTGAVAITSGDSTITLSANSGSSDILAASGYTPTADLALTTKSYVDGVASGLDVKASAHQGTTGDLNATYANGTLGQGATLTAVVNGVFPPQDNHYFGGVGSRVLVKDQTDPIENGIYDITDAGTGEEVTEFVTVDGLTGAEYFTFSDGASAAFYVWFDLDDGSADPTPGGTGIEADIATGHTVTDVRDAAIAAINASAADATAYLDEDDIFYIVNGTAGTQTDAAAGTSGFTVTVTSEGAAATAWILTRSEDADNSPSNEVSGGMFVFIEDGSTQANTGWVLSEPTGDAVLGTDDLVFTQFSGAGSITVVGGDAITVTAAGTDYTIDANVDGATIRVNGSDNLAVGEGTADMVLQSNGAGADATWGHSSNLRGASDGSLALSAIDVSSGVNFLEVSAGTTGSSAVTLAAAGTDTDVSIAITAQGAGFIDFTNDAAGDTLLSNVLNPVGAQDAATKDYVDTEIGNISQNLIENGTSNVSILSSNGDITMDVAGSLAVTVGSTLDVDVQLELAAQGAATPEYTFSSDLSAGMYYDASHAAAFAEGGVAAIGLGLSGGEPEMAGLSGSDLLLTPNSGTGNIIVPGTYDPSTDYALATKKYVDDAATADTAGDSRTLFLSQVDMTAASTSFANALPAGCIVTRVTMAVTNDSANAATTISVGDGTTVDKFMATSANDPFAIDTYISEGLVAQATSITPVVTVTTNAIGFADVMIEYRFAE